jgi:3-methyl-2-oxobutanoate hydroxymethyltransferase
MSRVNLPKLHRMREEGVRIPVLTCYDASFAALLESAGIEVLLVGDSLGMVLQGHDSTLPVGIDDMVYHTACTARGASSAFIVADLPFGSYQESPEQAYRSSARLMAAGAHMVKLEGGAEFAATVRFITRRGIPVCGHLGLTPQSVHQLGGYRVQGRSADAEQTLLSDAQALEEAGAEMLVLEAIPAKLAARITTESGLITIGIGAGPQCSGQVLVLHDMLDVFPGKKARFVRNFMAGASGIANAVERYAKAVREGSFPGEEHSF